MNWVLFGVGVATAALFVVLGWAVRYRKAYWLISGYNMMNDEQKSRVDVDGLAKMLFSWLLAGAAIFLVAFTLMALDRMTAGLCVFALVVPWIVGLLVQAQHYDANARGADGRWSRKTRWIIGALAVGMLLLAGFVGWAIHQGEQPVVYTVADGKLTISCTFGGMVPLSEIRDVQLLAGLPPVASRDYGSATDTHLKGTFTLQGGGSARIYARTDATAVVRFTTSEGRVYLLSAEIAEQTQQLYRDLGGK